MPVHIDPEDDHDPDVAAARLPSREVVRDDLTGLLADLPRPDRVVLHYLDEQIKGHPVICSICLLYTSDAADERSSVDLGGRRILKKKKYSHTPSWRYSHQLDRTLITHNNILISKHTKHK